MSRSSTRHDREIYGYDSAGETAVMHGELYNDYHGYENSLPTADYLCGVGGWTDEGACSG